MATQVTAQQKPALAAEDIAKLRGLKAACESAKTIAEGKPSDASLVKIAADAQAAYAEFAKLPAVVTAVNCRLQGKESVGGLLVSIEIVRVNGEVDTLQYEDRVLFANEYPAIPAIGVKTCDTFLTNQLESRAANIAINTTRAIITKYAAQLTDAKTQVAARGSLKAMIDLFVGGTNFGKELSLLGNAIASDTELVAYLRAALTTRNAETKKKSTSSKVIAVANVI